MRRLSKRAFMLGELIVSLTVLGTLLVSLALSLNGLRRFNHYQWMRQRCIAAAQAQLDCFARSQQALEPHDVNELWPGVTTTIQSSPGQAEWEGLTLVKVQAIAPSYRRQVQVQLARYCAPQQGGGRHD